MRFFMGFDNTTIPVRHQLTYQELAYCLMKRNMGLRATGWYGSSDCFLKGVYKEADFKRDHIQVFLGAASESRNRPHVGTGFYLVPSLPNYLDAMAMAEKAIPGWSHCEDDFKREAAVLVFQFMGLSLSSPCEQVFCFYDAEEGSRRHNWFFGFAQSHGAKLVNLLDEKVRYKVEDFVAENTLNF